MGFLLTASSIVLGSPAWAGFVLTTGLVFLLLLLVFTLRSVAPPLLKWGLFLLKGLAVVLLGLCLLDPLLTNSRATPGENIVVLLADQSASMGMQDAGTNHATRGEFIRKQLDSNTHWLTRLMQDFDVRRYSFGATLTHLDHFEELQFQSPASNLGAALSGLKNRFSHQPLAAVFLFTDGNSTDELPADLLGSGIPVFPIVDDRSLPMQDIRIRQVSVSQSNFEDAPVSVQGIIGFSGKRPQKVVVSIEQHGSPDGKTRQTQTLAVDPQNDLTVRFQLKPRKPGALFYILTVHDEAEPEALTNTRTSREATLTNNRYWIAVNRDPHVSRILYVGGRPNWEHKFLNRALEEDPQLQLASLIRIARKEARFDFRGRATDSNNPLFRGFEPDADEATEDYSQPVLVRLNMRDASELRDGFPKEKTALFQYDAIVLDDVEAAFFTHDQQSLIDRFVAERGGGLLMLGGLESFRNGKWMNTPVADTLPVYLNRAAMGIAPDYRWQLTKEGWLEPWLRLRDNEQAEQTRFQDQPALTILSAVSQSKPGARLLAEVQNSQGQKSPAVVVQQYGNGRAGAILAGDLWRWTLQANETNAGDGGKIWRQIARWLTGDAPQRVATSVSQLELNGHPSTLIQVRVKDKEYLPASGSRVEVEVLQPDGTKVSVDAQPGLSEAGLFESQYFSRQAGPYVAQVKVTGDANEPPYVREVGWSSDPAAKEFANAEVNRALLSELAQRTGGEIISPAQLEEFVARFPQRKMPVMETTVHPLWHQPAILITVLALLVCEWGLRRRNGMA